jgi:hypothetical protein
MQDGFRAVRMTLVWPAGASTPDPGAITALNRLPTGMNLVLDLYASPLPVDDAGRALLARRDGRDWVRASGLLLLAYHRGRRAGSLTLALSRCGGRGDS